MRAILSCLRCGGACRGGEIRLCVGGRHELLGKERELYYGPGATAVSAVPGGLGRIYEYC